MKLHETKEFKTLQKKWYKKLKASGFKDIELSEDELVRYSFHLTDAWRAGTFDYYVRAQDFLNTHTFKTDLDKKIWSLHADGLSIREISHTLQQKRTRKPLKRSAINERIRSIEAFMLKKSA